MYSVGGMVKGVCLSLFGAGLVGCSSGPSMQYNRSETGYSAQYERVADSVTLLGARSIASSTAELGVTALSYDQAVSDADFDYLSHAYAPGNLEELADLVCGSGSTKRNPVVGVPEVQFYVDGSPMQMRFAETPGRYGTVFGVNSDYCDGGTLDAVFMSSIGSIGEVPWLEEAKRSSHLVRNGHFFLETMPSFAMVSRSEGSAVSGLFLVRGQHQVEVPVFINKLYASDLSEAYVFTPTFFDNPLR